MTGVQTCALPICYREAFEQAGVGQGMEAWEQAFAQFARVSRAIESTTQQMFVLPWSGQTDAPASGAQKATVTLTFQRSRWLERPIVLRAGQVFAGELAVDWGDPEGEIFETGRRYTLLEDLVFHPGDTGPFSVACEAEAPGQGYNNPAAGTIATVSQAGRNFYNDLATVTVEDPTTVGAGSACQTWLTADNVPEMFIPEHIGQYILFTGGLNNLETARVVSFAPPPADGSAGSAVELAFEQSVSGPVHTGTFQVGEIATFSGSGAEVQILGERSRVGEKVVTYVVRRGNAAAIAAGQVLTGATSGATLTVLAQLYPWFPQAEAPVAGVGGASWRPLRWAEDLGLEVTNASAPTGGRAPWLDSIGDERSLARAPGETDDVYRDRVARIADVVSPNAIRRALSRTLINFPWCFREVGTPEFPGAFYDTDDGGGEGGDKTVSTAIADRCDAYDTDLIILTGAAVLGTFRGEPGDPGASEPIQLETTTNDAVLKGWFGKLVGTDVWLVRTEGKVPASVAGLQVRGLISGAVCGPLVSVTVPASVNARRFRTWLSNRDFRAYFLVGLPRLGAGEFGFAYDDGAADAWDWAVFDGFARSMPALHRGVVQALDTVRAGGVGFDIYIEDVGCP